MLGSKINLTVLAALVVLFMAACNQRDTDEIANQLYVSASVNARALLSNNESHVTRFEDFLEAQKALVELSRDFGSTNVAVQLESETLRLSGLTKSELLSMRSGLELAAKVENNPVIPLVEFSLDPRAVGFRSFYSAWAPFLLWAHLDSIYQHGTYEQAKLAFDIVLSGCSPNRVSTDRISEIVSELLEDTAATKTREYPECSPIPIDGSARLFPLAHYASYYSDEQLAPAISALWDSLVNEEDVVLTDLSLKVSEVVVAGLSNNGWTEKANSIVEQVVEAETAAEEDLDEAQFDRHRYRGRLMKAYKSTQAADELTAAIEKGLKLETEYFAFSALTDTLRRLGEIADKSATEGYLDALREWTLGMPESDASQQALVIDLAELGLDLGHEHYAQRLIYEAKRAPLSDNSFYNVVSIAKVEERIRSGSSESALKSYIRWLEANESNVSSVAERNRRRGRTYILLGQHEKGFEILSASNDSENEGAIRNAIEDLADHGNLLEAIRYTRHLESVNAILLVHKNLLEDLIAEGRQPSFEEIQAFSDFVERALKVAKESLRNS